MAKKDNTDNTDNTVRTAEQATVAFVARAQWYGRNYGNQSDISRGLRAIGLGEYIDGNRDKFAVKLDTLKTLLPDVLEVEMEPGYGYHPGNSSYVTDRLYDRIIEWRSNLPASEWAEVPKSSKLVDVKAAIRLYGAGDQLPPVEGDEPHATWKELVDKALEYGEKRGLCDTLENIIRSMGFGEFLPPASVTVDLQWRGVVFRDIEVRTNRKGEPRTEELSAHIRELARREYDQIEVVMPSDTNPVTVAA